MAKKEKLRTLYIDRGTEYSISYAHQHKVGDVTSAFPLTGCKLYFTIKPLEYDSNSTDNSAAVKRTLPDDAPFTDAAAGLTTITLTDIETQLDPTITYYGDIKVEEPGRVGSIKTFETKFLINGSPTNRNLSNG